MTYDPFTDTRSEAEQFSDAGLFQAQTPPTGRTGADWEEYWEKTYGGFDAAKGENHE